MSNLDKDIYSTLVDAASHVNKEAKTEYVIPGKAANASDVEIWVPTRSVLLNLLMGLGSGVPLGRIIEIFGSWSHGKSTILQEIMTAFQKYPGISVNLDSEGAWSRPRAVTMGHDDSRHLHVQADTLEAGFACIHGIIDKLRSKESKLPAGRPVVFGWDTIAACQTEAEKKSGAYGGGMAHAPRVQRQGMRSLSMKIPNSQVTLIILNQEIATMSMYGPSTTTPGGGAVKFWSSERLHVSKAGQFMIGSKEEGIIVRVKLVKSKLSPPNKTIDIPVSFTHGIDVDYESFHYLGANSAHVNTRGGWQYIEGFGDKTISLRHSKLKEKLDATEGLREWMQEKVEEVWFGL